MAITILFWNLMKKELAKYAAKLIASRDVDMALFAEHQALDIAALTQKLPDYTLLLDPGCEKIIALCRNSLNTATRRGSHYYTIIHAKAGQHNLIVTGLHLPAMPQGKAKRLMLSSEITADISEQERLLKSRESIVIGDFNSNPFDEELTMHNAFNAVLFRDLIDRIETASILKKKYTRFYNPVLAHFSENPQNYGSYYFHDENRPLYWQCLDQVLVRKSLAHSISSLEYCRKIGRTSLMTRGGLVDEKRFSDHLPLLVKFDLEEETYQHEFLGTNQE